MDSNLQKLVDEHDTRLISFGAQDVSEIDLNRFFGWKEDNEED